MKTLRPKFSILTESWENPKRIKHLGVLTQEIVCCVFKTDYPRKVYEAGFEGYVFMPGHIYSLN